LELIKRLETIRKELDLLIRDAHLNTQNEPQDDSQLLNIEQVAQLLRSSKSAVGELLRDNVLPAVEIPSLGSGTRRRLRVRKSSLLKWIDGQEAGGYNNK
jgi:hypothetical protein